MYQQPMNRNPQESLIVDKNAKQEDEDTQKTTRKFKYPFSISAQFRKLSLPEYKSQYCKHRYGCIQTILSATTKTALAGMLIKIGMNLLFGLRKIITKPKNIVNLLFNKDVFLFGGFLGSLVLLFRSAVCLLRRIMKEERQKYIPLISGFIAGLFSVLFLEKKQRQAYGLFLLARSVDITYTSLVKKGIVPEFKYFYVLLYSLTISTTGYIYSTDPSVIPPQVYRFYLLFNTETVHDLQMRQIWIQRQNNYLASKGITPINSLDYLPKLKAYLKHFKLTN